MRVLIVKPSALGDVVLSLPLVYNLNKKKCIVDFLIFRDYADILDLVNGISYKLVLDRKFYKRPIYFFKFIKNLRKITYDYIIDLQGLFRSAFISFLARGREKIAHSLCREFSYLFVKPVSKFNDKEHVIYRNLKTYEYIFQKKDYEINFPWKKSDLEKYYLFKKEKDKLYLGLSPLSTSKFKDYPLEFYPSLIKKVKKLIPNLKLVIFGSKSQKERLSSLVKSLSDYVEIIDLVGKTNLKELVANISLCDFFLAPDTGPMHIAWSLGVKTIALFGSTSWIMKGPLKNGTAIFKKISCNPCEKSKPPCPFPQCMYVISQKDILKAFEKFL